MMHRLATRLQLPFVLLLAGLLALFALALTGCRVSPVAHSLTTPPAVIGDTARAPVAPLAEKTRAEKETEKNTPPARSEYHGFRAGPRYRKDAAAWADAERARQGIAPVPRKVKGGSVVTIASGNGTASTTAATAKNAAAASDSATVLNAPKAQQAALAGAGATITQTPPRTWSWWLLILAGAAGYGMYRTLKA